MPNDKECLDCEETFTPDNEDQDVCDECWALRDLEEATWDTEQRFGLDE